MTAEALLRFIVDGLEHAHAYPREISRETAGVFALNPLVVVSAFPLGVNSNRSRCVNWPEGILGGKPRVFQFDLLSCSLDVGRVFGELVFEAGTDVPSAVDRQPSHLASGFLVEMPGE